jgi:hypothetical protein
MPHSSIFDSTTIAFLWWVQTGSCIEDKSCSLPPSLCRQQPRGFGVLAVHVFPISLHSGSKSASFSAISLTAFVPARSIAFRSQSRADFRFPS